MSASSDSDVLEYFDIPDRKAIQVTWAHAVNSRHELEDALEGDFIKLMSYIV